MKKFLTLTITATAVRFASGAKSTFNNNELNDKEIDECCTKSDHKDHLVSHSPAGLHIRAYLPGKQGKESRTRSPDGHPQSRKKDRRQV